MADFNLSAENNEADGLLNAYLEDIYNGNWNNDRILTDVYFHTAKTLLDGYKQGYNKSFFKADWTVKDNNLLTAVQNNIFAFSGAKSFAELNVLRDAVYENGNLLSFSDFKRRARQINKDYNINYLNAERQTVISAATQGSRWMDIEETKEEFPYLEYVTARDEHVREEHRVLDGIVLPVDDPFWQSYYPPNGFRCRCSTRSHTERTANHAISKYKGKMPESEEAQKMAGKVVAKPFRHNTGAAQMVFSPDKHPYFKENADAKALQLSAVKNYGMKPAKVIYDNNQQLSHYSGDITDKASYLKYWESLELKYGKTGNGFTLTDKRNNISASFDNALKEKIIVRERYGYFDEILNIFQSPDEVWGTFKSGNKRGFKEEFFNVHIRYYEDKPVVLLINKDGRVDSFYRLDTVDAVEQFRVGLLKRKR